MNQPAQPLSYHDLKALGDPGDAIAQHRAQGAREIDWSQCGLVQAYALPGEVSPDAVSRTSRRRRTLTA